ncbi:MAG: esterase-like activity of phytase family protein [Mangrovicoccus sp.]|nr:esterase-like activity of phytase family protein [Mangrovicoccus sp.]
MPDRSRFQLIAFLLPLLLALIGGLGVLGLRAQPPSHTLGAAQYLGSYTWPARGDDRHGGLSGLQVSEDGQSFVVISDRSAFAKGRFKRGAQDQIIGVQAERFQPLRYAQTGGPLALNDIDAEGLTRLPDGQWLISFEARARLGVLDLDTGKVTDWPIPAQFRKLQFNSGLEALANDPQGRVIAIPERSGKLERPFPVYRHEDGRWSVPYGLRRDDSPFLVVGADLGPDGRLYVLERHYLEWRGFASRVRSFAFGPEGLRDEQLILQSEIGDHDNLEAISVWRDRAGDLRLTMVSDDNFFLLQRSEFVEYRLAQD